MVGRLYVSSKELVEHFFGTYDPAPLSVGVGGLMAIDFDDHKSFFANVDHADLRRALRLSSVASRGMDGISLAVIKNTLSCLEPVYLYLFNFSLMHGIFPTLWKYALIHPIPKVQSLAEPLDYRPVSLLCSLSKVLEKLRGRLATFLRRMVSTTRGSRLIDGDIALRQLCCVLRMIFGRRLMGEG